MKVYFTASLRGKQNSDLDYEKIFSLIESLGHKNLDDIVLRKSESRFYQGSHEEQVRLYKQALNNINTADVVILDVSIPSLSMGYVLQKALENSKPVIALYKKGYVPFFALGIDNEKLQVIDYTDNSLEKDLKEALQTAQDSADVRFNFFISPEIGKYLDWISRVKKLPRSVYLRALIEEDLERNKEYSRSQTQ